MSRPRKYVSGPVVREPISVLNEILAGRYVFMNGTPKHPAWVSSMSVHTVSIGARKGAFALALPNPDHPENKKETTDV